MNRVVYEALRTEVGAGRKVRLFSCCGGPELGEEALVRDGQTICAPGLEPFWAEWMPKLIEGYQEMEGHSFFVQTLAPPSRLILCGSGHIAQALAKLAPALRFAVVAADDRPGLTTLFGPKVYIRPGPLPEALEGLQPGMTDFYVILTHSHKLDEDCLRAVLNRPSVYIGMIGSRAKVAAIRSRLLAEGVAEEALNAVHAPVGLDIGAETPEEIALSIAAQLVQCRHALQLDGVLPGAITASLLRPPYALVTVLHKSGSTPRNAGAKMLVFPDGATRGTIGGGALETHAAAQAVECLAKGIPLRDLYHMDGQPGNMLCGGTAEYLIVPVE